VLLAKKTEVFERAELGEAEGTHAVFCHDDLIHVMHERQTIEACHRLQVVIQCPLWLLLARSLMHVSLPRDVDRRLGEVHLDSRAAARFAQRPYRLDAHHRTLDLLPSRYWHRLLAIVAASKHIIATFEQLHIDRVTDGDIPFALFKSDPGGIGADPTLGCASLQRVVKAAEPSNIVP